MQAESPAGDTYRFGSYELRLKSRELLLDGEVVELQPRVFDLLAFLLEHRDRVVTKDELLEAIWPGAVVTEASLARAVMKARKAVNDDAEQQHSIKTVHGYGYRFVAELAEAPAPATEPAATTATDSRPVSLPPAWSSQKLLRVAGAGLVVVIALGLLFSQRWFTSDSPAAEAARIAVLPIANQTGETDMDWVTYGLMDMLAGELRRSGGLRVLASSDVVGLLGDRGSATSAMPEDLSSLYAQLYARFGATHVIRGVLTRPGQFYRVNADIVQQGGNTRRVEFLGSDPLNLIVEFRRALASTLPAAKEVAIAEAVVSDDMFVNEAYARGRDQMLRGNLEQAETLLRSAVAEEPDNFWARHALATTRLNLGEAREAAEVLLQLAEEARQKKLQPEEAAALYQLGNAHLRLDEYLTARDFYLRASAIYETLGLHFENAGVLNSLAIVAGELQEYVEERALLERAVQAFEKAGIDSIPGHVLGGLANNAMDSGRLDEAQQYLERALVSFDDEGLSAQKAVALFSFSRVEEYRGHYASAELLAQQSLDLAREIGHRWGETASLRRLASARYLQGKLDAAEAVLQEALVLTRELGITAELAATLNDLSKIERLRGQYDTADQMLTQATQIVTDMGDDIGVLWVGIQRGWLELVQGDTAGAIETSLTVLAAEDLMVPHLAVDAHLLHASALLAEGKPERALEVLQAGRSAAEQGSDLVRRAAVASALGRLELQLGREDLALAYLGMARDAAPDIYETLMLDGAIAAQQQDWEKASVLLEEARREAGGRWTDEEEAFLREALADAPARG